MRLSCFRHCWYQHQYPNRGNSRVDAIKSVVSFCCADHTSGVADNAGLTVKVFGVQLFANGQKNTIMLSISTNTQKVNISRSTRELKKCLLTYANSSALLEDNQKLNRLLAAKALPTQLLSRTLNSHLDFDLNALILTVSNNSE